MADRSTRRDFLKTTTVVTACASGIIASPPALAQEPIKRVGDSSLKVSLNAYSFSKLLNDFNKHRGPGISLISLLDFCAKNNFDGVDPTGYFFQRIQTYQKTITPTSSNGEHLNLAWALAGPAYGIISPLPIKQCGLPAFNTLKIGSRLRPAWGRRSCEYSPTRRSKA